MKKSIIIISLFIIAFQYNALSQSSEPQNIERKILFTLDSTEIIHYNEYTIMTDLQGHYFAALVYNKSTKKYSLVFNGSRVVEDMDEYLYWPDNVYINPKVQNSFSISYLKDNLYYANINGEEYGPYDYVNIVGEKKFFYMLDNKTYFNDKGIVRGPFEGWFPYNIKESGKYAFSFKKEGQYFVNANSKIFGPYSNVRSTYIAENGKFAFHYYNENREQFINYNGDSIYGPFKRCSDLVFTDDGQYAFVFNENDNSFGCYVNHNGNIIGPFSRNSIYDYGLSINEDGKLLYSYEEGEYRDTYLNIDGVIKGPYSNCKFSHITDDGNIIYAYTDIGKSSNINNIIYDGEIIGSYYQSYYFVVSKSGKLAFIYIEWIQNRSYEFVYYDGDTLGPYSNIKDLQFIAEGFLDFTYNDLGNAARYNYNGGEPEQKHHFQRFQNKFKLFSNDKKHYFISERENQYVIIDGVNFGDNSALSAFYNEERNSFVWNILEGNELVVYEYKLD
ncbi:MAG TPA: hypothetical protein PKN32_13890 [Bacteroidales bacterium]|nr:hypothetical protein [Bacteroidales bacterium]